MKSSGRGSRRKTAIRFLTWKDMAGRRNEVMDMVAQVVSWAKAGGSNRFVRLLATPNTNVFDQAEGLCS
jgi:hypothetical protein